jgi:hypothetical protein
VLPELVLPELVLPEPELPVLELDDGAVVDELLVEPVPELPVEEDVVAALATNAPPATRPEVSALVASTLRRRIFIGCVPFHLVRSASPFGPGTTHGAPRIWVRPHNGVGVRVELFDAPMTIHTPFAVAVSQEASRCLAGDVTALHRRRGQAVGSSCHTPASSR